MTKEVDLFSRSRRWRLIFFLTIVLRTWFSISPSYIHPDEHFQGPEAIADTIFGWATKKSWEFTSDYPARSFISIWAMYGIPMSFAEALYGRIEPMTMYYLLRMGFAVGTWVLTDMAIDRLSTSKQDRIKNMVFVASSYVTWTFQSHTFSNSVETVVLLWCLVIIHEFNHARTNLLLRHFDTTLLGLLVTFGVFNRITFPAFLVLPGLSILKHFKQNPMTMVSFGLSAALTAACAIWIDTWCYGTSASHIITPLNSVLYNINSSNLADHGLHSRFNHLFVNLPQLLGPGLILLASRKYLTSLPMQAAVSGLAMLSLIPHQEPRFLIPIVPLLCCCFDVSWLSNKTLKAVFAAWAVFNLLLGVLMGNLHQGGVVPTQAYIGKNLTKPGSGSTVLWWKTYSPPIWIMGQPTESVKVLDPLVSGTDEERYAPIYSHISSKAYHNSTDITVIDMMGCKIEWLKDAMDKVSKTSASSKSLLRRAFLVAPDSVFDSTPELKALTKKQKHTTKAYRLSRTWGYKWHLSMESLDFGHVQTLKPGLGIWEIKSL